MTSDALTLHSLAPDDLKRRLDRRERVLVLDVRDPDEHKDWRIPGSVNLPLADILSGAEPPGTRDVDIVTVCAHGARSERARRALAARGYRVASLRGGMVAWNSVYDVARVDAPELDGTAEILQLRRVGKGCLSYMVISEGQAAVVDPTMDVDAYARAASERGADIVKVLDTHAHADHVSGSRALAQATGAEYLAPDELGPLAPHSPVREGTLVRVGRAELRALETPGHTPGSTTYLIGTLALTGDTLFVESVGRPDLGQDPGPHARVLHETLHRKILTLPEATRILPGHYGDGVAITPGTPIEATLGDLERGLRPLRFSEQEFVAWVTRNALPKPANFDTIKKFNKGIVTEVDRDELRELEAGPNRCAVGG